MHYPMILSPVFKEYVWGGKNLKKIYKGACSPDRIAESWVLSCHWDGITGIANGKYAGKTLNDYIQDTKGAVLGNYCNNGEMPLLLKIIDAADHLSIQVHPDTAYAGRVENQPGKKEAWYVMDCIRDAFLYYGFNRKLSREEFLARAKDGTILETLNRVSVKPGDVFFIDSGIIHAIGKGMTVVEIGSNCNITYRIFDYFRTDKYGKQRELHIEKAADVAVLEKIQAVPLMKNGIMDCADFYMQEIKLDGKMVITAGAESFHSLLCIKGNCLLLFNGLKIPVEIGTSLFVPADMGAYTLQGNSVVLKTAVGRRQN